MWMLVRRCGDLCVIHVGRYFFAAICLDDYEDARKRTSAKISSLTDLTVFTAMS